MPDNGVIAFMKVLVSCMSVLLLVIIGYLLSVFQKGQYISGIVLPYAAIIIFITGFIWRIVRWALSPVPFRIPTTCGQQKSLSTIKSSSIDNPSGLIGVIIRMFLEIVFFRSLFRNTRVELYNESKLAYGSSKWLWLGAIAFHWTFLIILVRHMRFFIDPVPSIVSVLERADGLFQIGVPVLYITNVLFGIALFYLLIRRIVVPKMKIISLYQDYFPLFLITGIAVTGILMRYFIKVDLLGVKSLMIGLTHFHPAIPHGIGSIFYIHLFLICFMAIYFPFSKLMHMPGVFLSPTRNLANNNRARRHINPWNQAVAVHTYEEWEEEFHDKLKSAGFELEKE